MSRRRLRPIDLTARAQSEPVLADLAGRWPAQAGALLLVGGAPRDWLLGRAPRDLDFILESDGEAGALWLEDLAASHKGRVVVFDRRGLRERRLVIGGRELDFVLVQKGGVPAELRRRDFTINALAVELPGGRLLDPAGGLEDLAEGRLRALSEQTFSDDPLRALRAVRLLAEEAAGEVEHATESSLRRHAAAVAGCAGERIGAEMDRLAASGRFGAALERMLNWGLAAALMPEAARLAGVTQNRFHHLDCWQHTVAAVALCDDPAALASRLGGGDQPPPPAPAGEDRLVLSWAALFHDLGKPDTRTVGDDGLVHFYGHEKISEQAGDALGRRWHFPRRRLKRISSLVRHHLRPGALGAGASERALRRLIHAAGPNIELLLLLSLADTGAARGIDHERRMSDLEETGRRVRRLLETFRAELTAPRPLLGGHEVMALTGLSPGPRLGRVLTALLRLQVDGEVHDRSGAEEAVRRLLADGREDGPD